MTQFSNNNYDLEERTAKFGEDIIEFCKNIEQNAITRPIISQLIRSGTSIGANYMEANGAATKKDLRHKLTLCRKEAKESSYWLKLISKQNPASYKVAAGLAKESYELTLIFSTILKKI